MRLYAADGVTLVSDWMRLRPSGRCTQDPTAPGHPPGVLVCVGPASGTLRGDLFGGDLSILFVAADDG
jgi:hypothetical protein